MRPGREVAERLLSGPCLRRTRTEKGRGQPRTNRYARCLEKRDTYKRILGTKESEKLAGQFAPTEIARQSRRVIYCFGTSRSQLAMHLVASNSMSAFLWAEWIRSRLRHKHKRLLSISKIDCTFERQRLYPALFACRVCKRLLKGSGIRIDLICIRSGNQCDHERKPRLDLHTDLLPIPLRAQQRVNLRSRA